MKMLYHIIFLLCLSTTLFAAEKDKKNNTLSPIKIYQDYISPIDGDRCTMYPSCSQYSKIAFKKHGFIKGFIMTCDRLLRCGGDEMKVSKIIVIKGNRYIYDPVEND
jgi:putative membrane protein insertion efficiency factor